mgnify:FL=1
MTKEESERLDRIEQHLRSLKLNDEKQGDLLIDIKNTLIGSHLNGNKGLVNLVGELDSRLKTVEQKQALAYEKLSTIKWTSRTIGGAIVAFFLWFFTNKHN